MKILNISLVALTIAATASAQIVLDDFNSGVVAGEGSAVDGTSWVGQVTQGATTITIGGTAKDDNGWGIVGIDPINASSFSEITVIGQRDTGNLATSFQIELLNSSFSTHILSVSMASFNIGSLTTVVIPITWGAYDATSIIGWSIGGGIPPTGTDAFRMTLDNLAFTTAAVPEPSTYAILIGLLSLGYVAVRKRSSKQA